MGDPCKPKNQVALDRALGQLTGDLFAEAERVKNFTGEQRFYYENTLSKYLGLGDKGKGPSAWDVVAKYTGKSKPKGADKVKTLLDGQMYARPSELFKGKFYDSIDRKFNEWQKTADGSYDSYREHIAKPVGDVINAIEVDIIKAKTRADLSRRLKKYGLSLDNVYYAKEYLNWLKQGGPIKPASNSFVEGINQVGSNLAKAQANMQLLWTLGNGVDMVRVYSHYVTRKPTSVYNVLQGTVDAMRATKGQPWRRIPELEKKGVYSSDYVDRGGSNVTPFELSITAQKNLTYFLDKAAGGNGTDGVRDMLFDSKSWDRPAWDRSPDQKLVFDLVRYPINESRWLLKTINKARSGDMREATNLMVYSLARAYFVGAASMVPAPLYLKLTQHEKESIKEFDNAMKLNLVRHVSGQMFKAMGLDGMELDLSKYTQPFGGSLGARAQSIADIMSKASGSGLAAGKDLMQGKVKAAALRSAEAGMALTNLGIWGWAVQKLGPANATEFTRMLDTMAKHAEGEFTNPGSYKRELTKSFFGSAVRKSDSNSGGNAEMPSLPEPKMPSLPK